MTSAIQNYWRAVAKKSRRTQFVRAPSVVCADGFQMSVQASEFHYCSPRETILSGDYSAWEIGFPSAVEDALLPYQDGDGDPKETVYGYVPTHVVDAVIAKHGGIVATK